MGFFASLFARFRPRPTAVVTHGPAVERSASAVASRSTPSPAESPAAQHAAAATATIAPPAERTAEEKRAAELAALRRSFQEGILDRRFQALEIDVRFLADLDGLLARGPGDFALPPAAAFDVIRLLDHPGYPVRKVAAAISCDPTLAGSVLARANSPLHRGAVAVESLPDAVVRLGQRHLRLLLMEIALQSTRVHGRPYETLSNLLWKHSLFVAQVARGLAGPAGVDPEHAYLAGLFHAIGSFATLAAARRLALRQERRLSPQTLLAAIVRHGYAMNGPLLDRWRVPAPVTRAVTWRREPRQAGDSARLAALIALSNDVGRPIGAWVERREVDLARHPSIELLRLDPIRLPTEAALLELAAKIERVAKLA